MVVGIIVTHGNLAEALAQTARSVLGDFEGCYTFSNVGMSTQGLHEEIVSALDETSPCIMFVDFLGGSCSHACLRIATERPNTKLMSGVNLPMLIAFLTKRGEVAFDELPSAVLQRARAAVDIVDPEEL